MRVLTALLLVLLAVLGPARAQPPGDATPPTPEMARHQDRLGEIEGRLARLKLTLTDREQHRDALYAELEQSEREIAVLARAGRELAAALAAQQRVVDDLVRRQQAAAEDLEQSRVLLAELLRTAHAVGRGDRLRMLLNQEDPLRMARMLGYWRAIGRERSKRIAEVRRLSRELGALRGEAEQEVARLAALAEQQAETKARLEQAQAERGAILASLEAAIVADRDHVAALGKDAAALRELIARLQLEAQIAAEIALHQEGIDTRRGRLDWPVAPARLLAHFGGAAAAGELYADGVLIAAREGSEVHAVHHGRVVYADWLRGFGLLLVVDHGDGYMTLYGQNQSLLKEVGEWVATGEVIALAGTGDPGGGADAPGIYFALRRHGEPIDPASWCRAADG